VHRATGRARCVGELEGRWAVLDSVNVARCESVFMGKLLPPSSGCESNMEAVYSSESLASLD